MSAAGHVDGPLASRATDVAARVGEIAPEILAFADAAERSRRLPPALLDALHGAGLFRLLLPRAYGGEELSLPEFARAMEALAALDASTAWCVCQANGCAMTAAYLDPSTAQAIWGRDPRAVVAWGPGRAIATADGHRDGHGDGYIVDCDCSFASGAHHATWLGAHCTLLDAGGAPRRLDTGQPEVRTMLFPAGATSLKAMWDVLGLRATGSDGYSVKGLRVPCEHAVARDAPAERRIDAPLYRFIQMDLFATGYCGVAIGIARAMLDAFRRLADAKTPRLSTRALAAEGSVQADFARAEARLRAARALLLDEVSNIWDATVAGAPVTIEERARIRLATTHGIHEAKAAGDVAYEHAGATAIFESSAFERRFRDLHTVTQQLQGRRAHYQSVGAYLLGQASTEQLGGG